MIALFNMRHIAADVSHNTSTLVSKGGRRLGGGITHLVQLGMADTGREKFDDHLVRARVRDLYFVNRERSAMPGVYGCN